MLMRTARCREPALFYKIELCSACNLRCTYCPQSLAAGPKRRLISEEVFDVVLKRLRVVRGSIVDISLFIGGEPTLHPRLFEHASRVANELCIRPAIATNAAGFDRLYAERLSSHPFRSIAVDFHADKNAFEALRVGAKWETVRDNIVAMAEASERQGRSGPLIIVIDIGMFSPNEKRIAEVLPKCDAITITSIRPHNWAGDIEMGIHPDVRPSVCDQPWLMFAVNAEGKVVGCCRDAINKQVLGDLTTQGVMDIWNGRAYAEFRKNVAALRYERIPLCAQCDRPYTGGVVRHAARWLRPWIRKKDRTLAVAD
jgi:organic radical activating enzyme